MSDEYTVILRGQRFTLTRDQVEADSPNYFTNCFLGEYTESQTREVKLGRNPALFAFIVEHLSGYEFLPLPDSAILPGTTKKLMMDNLLADALFYSLDGLHAKMEKCMLDPPLSPTVYELWTFKRDWPSGNKEERPKRQWKTIIDEKTAESMSVRYGVEKNPGLLGFRRGFLDVMGSGGRMVACWREEDSSNVGLIVVRTL